MDPRVDAFPHSQLRGRHGRASTGVRRSAGRPPHRKMRKNGDDAVRPSVCSTTHGPSGPAAGSARQRWKRPGPRRARQRIPRPRFRSKRRRQHRRAQIRSESAARLHHLARQPHCPADQRASPRQGPCSGPVLRLPGNTREVSKTGPGGASPSGALFTAARRRSRQGPATRRAACRQRNLGLPSSSTSLAVDVRDFAEAGVRVADRDEDGRLSPQTAGR